MHALPPKRAGVPPAGRLKPRSQSCTTRAQTQLGMHHYVQAYRITHNYCGHQRSPEPFQMCKASQIEIFAQTACPASLHHASTCTFLKRRASQQGARTRTRPTLQTRAWQCAEKSQRPMSIGTCFPRTAPRRTYVESARQLNCVCHHQRQLA